MSYNIHHNFLVNSSPAMVFDAFCTPQGLNSWWTLKSVGRPELSNIYTFYFGPAHDWRAKVIEVDSGLKMTWQMTQAMEDWMPTQVGFELKPQDNFTSVSFFHKNWAEQSEHFGITTYCWGQLLAGLKKYVEDGSIIPFDKRN